MTFSSRLWKTLTTPPVPHTACALSATTLAVAEVRRHRGLPHLERSGAVPITAATLAPSFDEPNIPNPQGLLATLRQLLERTGLAREKKWAVGMPEETVRTAIVTLDGDIKGRREIEDMLVWKAERLVGNAISELRLSTHPLSPVGGQQRYLVALAKEAVMREYEEVFAQLGWQAGLIWPRPLCEAQWLRRPGALPNQILFSTSQGLLTVMICRNGEPVLLRSQRLAPDEELCDTLHRLLFFYRDRATEIIPGIRATENPFADTVFEILLVGDDLDHTVVCDQVQDTFGVQPVVITPEVLGFAGSTVNFGQQAAAAGLALASAE